MKKIQSALISVFNKDKIENICSLLYENNVKIYSTGGTYDFISKLGIKLEKVEDITSYPSILNGRVSIPCINWNALKGLMADPKSLSNVVLAFKINAIGPNGLLASVQITP